MLKRILLIAFILVLLLSGLAQGQDSSQLINPGENRLGNLTADSTAVFTFVADPGQPMIVRVLAVTADLAPALRVTDNSGTVIDEEANASGATTVEMSVTVPQDAVYRVEVYSANGAAGEFVISLEEGSPPPPPTPLTSGEPVSAFIDSNTPMQRYSFSAATGETLVLTVRSGTPSGGPAIRLEDAATGETLASLSPRFSGGTFSIPPDSGSYVLQISGSGAVRDLFTVELGTSSGPVGGPTPTENVVPTPMPMTTPLRTATPFPTPTPVPTEGFELIPLPSTGPCVVATAGEVAVNVRNMPTTEGSDILTRLSPNVMATVLERNADSTWWRANVSGTVGWVSGAVTRLGGDCSGIPVPVEPPTATPTLPPPPAPLGPPDLVLTGISVPSFILKDATGTMQVTVANEGDTAAGAFRVIGQFTGPATPGTAVSNVAALAPGDSVTVPLDVSYSATGDYSVTFIVDDLDSVEEENEFNNSSSADLTVQLLAPLPPIQVTIIPLPPGP